MPRPERHKDLVVLPFPDPDTWLAWLARHHTRQDGIWIKFAKKNSGIRSVTYEQAREGAIIYGWIDGLINGYDELWYLTRFTPRRPRSQWSKINRAIAEELIRQDRMHAAGLAQVQAARKDGRWAAAYDSQSTIEVPADLQRRLKRDRAAREFFDSLNRASRYSYLYWIQQAARPETRQRRIEQTMELLRAGQSRPGSLRKKK
jgi:uncharacterized protein YdeI (YjbR/CyaY-like superfamily)